MQGVPDDEHHIVHITQLLFPDYRSQFSRHLGILSIRTENLVTRMTILYLLLRITILLILSIH